MKSRMELRIQKLESKLGSFDKVAEESGVSVEDIQNTIKYPELLTGEDQVRIKAAICALCEREFPGGVKEVDEAAVNTINETIKEMFAGGEELDSSSRKKIKAGLLSGSAGEIEEILKKLGADPNIDKIQTFNIPVPSRFMEIMSLIMFYANVAGDSAIPWLTVFAPIWIPMVIPYAVKAVAEKIENK